MQRKRKFVRELILFMISALLIFLLYNVAFYKDWTQKKIFSYYAEFNSQVRALDLDSRCKYRFGNNYTLSQNLKTYFDNMNSEDALLFLPPKAYLKKNRENYDWGECLSFYYFTGIRAVDMKSENLHEATHAVIANQDELKVIEISDEALLHRIIAEYKSFQQ